MKRSTLPIILLMTILFCASTSHAQIASDQALNYQINATHTGYVSAPEVAPPFKQKWSVNFGQQISYPIIADGKVFVTVRNSPATYGTKLYAIDGATGAIAWGPVDLGGTYFWSALCYENGRLFALNYNGLLRAFDGASGNIVWSKQLGGQSGYSSAPTVYQGVIYVSATKIQAVSADTGSILWTSPIWGGEQSSPAVTSDGVYVSYSCPNVYKLNPASGTLIWKYTPGCSGGGGKTPVLYDGRLYVRDYYDYIFDSQTGLQVGSFAPKNIPAFSGNMSFIMRGPKYFGSYGTLEGRDLTGNAVTWSFAGDNYLQTAPLVVNDYVYIGSRWGKLYAVEAATGRQVWSTNVGAEIPYVDEQNVSQPLTGLAAGEGLLVVPTMTTLVAYEHDRDEVAPTVTWGGKTPAANAAGWNNTPVNVPFTATDAASGVATPTPQNPLHFNAEGANQTQQVTISDNAGNSATFTSPPVNIDFTSPSTGAVLSGMSGASEWYSGAVEVTLTPSDALSGITNTFYRVDGGTTQTYAAPFTVSSDGSHTVNYWSVDAAGNVESQQSTIVKIDLGAPSTQASVSAAASANGWYQDTAQVTLNASDNSSGVADSFYTIDGGATQTYAAPFNISGGGSHTVNYWSVDALGNTEAQRSLTVNIDTSAPNTSLATTGTAGTNGWYRSWVQISLTPLDNQSGVASTYYSVDGGAAQAYTGSFTVSGNAQHNVSFWSVDKVGNTEAARSVAVKIDITSPDTSNAVTGPVGNSVYFRGAIQMSLTASDNLSGVATTHYRIDGGEIQTYTAPFTVSGDGTHPVEFWSVDMAGNNTTRSTSMIRIDATAPVTQAAATGPAGTNGWYRSAAQVALTATDNLSGMANSYYRVDGGVTQTYLGAFMVSSEGAHTVSFWSMDKANNTETQRSLPVWVDSSAPVITAAASPSSAPKRSTQLSVTVSGRITDTASGVNPNSATFSVIDEYGVSQPSGAVVLQADGSYSFRVNLPATRQSKDADGHKYTITVHATDQAGNMGAASTVVTIL
ncbi:MAG TPA: PQQ-binding-like beta-propeller repeat protein [Pyrinomonadaceae bacterium]|nr:PQQ-binding-like beta-propeller repeat protein [Pyrinomonadaceae bacterium]